LKIFSADPDCKKVTTYSTSGVKSPRFFRGRCEKAGDETLIKIFKQTLIEKFLPDLAEKISAESGWKKSTRGVCSEGTLAGQLHPVGGCQEGYAHPGSFQPPFTLVFRPGDHISQNNDSISIQFHSFTSENDDTI
jgi:hypothetical protein